MRTLDDVDWQDKAALVRADFNVPLAGTRIADDTRIAAALDTLTYLLDRQAAVTVMSHLGRPDPAKPDPALSLEPVAAKLACLLGRDVPLVALDQAQRPAAGAIQLLENTRFNPGEKSNDPKLAARYANCGDVFVMDAFATAHRAEASTVALAQAVAERCAGKLMQAECLALERAMSDPARPLLAAIGGAKVSTKLAVLESLAKLADQVIVGGGIANTFLAAQGLAVGKSLYEPDLTDTCSAMLLAAPDKFIVPTDVVTAKSVDAAHGEIKQASAVDADDLILDAGPNSSAAVEAAVARAQTVIWNGALGVFEREPFSDATRRLARALASSPAFSLAGGGETVAAINQYQVADKISYLSTGGGAFLQFVEGGALPGIDALQ